MSLASLLLTAGLASCTELGTAELDKLAGTDRVVMLRVEKTSLDRVLKMLGRVGGFQTTFHGFTPTVPGVYENVTLREVLEELARDHGLALRVPESGRLEVRAPALSGIGGIVPPRVKQEVAAAFPPGSRADRARVVLSALVCEDGRVGALAVRESPLEIGFREAALQAVRDWTFEPATSEGKPLPAYFVVTVDFVRP